MSLSDGGRLSFTISADISAGIPVLLNRPLGGSMELWGSFAERIARFFPVISFDPRGVGSSSDPPLFQSTRGMARDAVELLNRLGVRRTHVFGISMGGMVASWIAIDAPERVATLVLASTLPAAATLLHRTFHDLVRLGRTLAVPGPGGEAGLVRAVLSPQFRRRHPERVAAIEAKIEAAPTSRRNLAVHLIASSRHDVGACLRHVKADTLLLLGSADRIATRKSQRELLRLIPHAVLSIIPGAGHDLTLEQPEQTADAMLAFLKAHHVSINKS